MQFHFADHVLDVARRELRRSGGPIALEPQVFDLLVHLIHNRDRVVTKDDLLNSVWGGRIVSESTLTSRINAARRAIGDSGEAQCLIRTVPRKGFRFVGDVTEGQPTEPRPWPPIMDGVIRLSAVEFAALFDGLDWTRVQTTRGIPTPTVAA
jgi:DNA-binding winged helix-turn-helix (wHTH) protein